MRERRTSGSVGGRSREGPVYPTQIDGTPTQELAMYPTAIIATVAAGSVMTEGATADAWLRRSCHTPLRRENGGITITVCISSA